MKLWFGEEHGSDDPALTEVRETAARLKDLAEDAGMPRDDYVERLHEEAFEEAECAVQEAENSLNERLKRRLALADELRECRDRLREHLADAEDPEVEDLVREMDARQEEVVEEVETLAEDLAPNLSSLATPRLAARLIGLTGGLEELARKPGSTVQVLGAEKALFRHLAGAGEAPKHGVIYNHPDVQAAGERRGEVSRALSAKLVIAARIDNFSGKDETERLLDEWEKRLEEVG